jgi:hypothetical protein
MCRIAPCRSHKAAVSRNLEQAQDEESAMNWRRSTAGSVCRMTVRLSAAVALMLSTANLAPAQSSNSNGRTVEGTWYVEVTPRNCGTGAPAGPVINGLVTFAAGGTLTEAAGGTAFAPGQRSPGHGTWSHQGGPTYQQRFVAMILFTTAPGASGPGFEAGWQTVDHTVEVIDSDHIESSGGNKFYRMNGELYRSGCSTASGRRFE